MGTKLGWVTVRLLFVDEADSPVGGTGERPRTEQTVNDRVREGLPRSGDDVLGDPDGGPGSVTVRGVDEDPGDRSGAFGRVEHPYPVVDQVNPGERSEERRV